VAFTTVPLGNLNYQTPTGESAVLWDSAAAGQLFRQIRADQRPAAVTPPPRRRHPAKPGTPAASRTATTAPSPAPSQPTGAAAGGQEKTAAQDTCH
jgi:hypothetical protein